MIPTLRHLRAPAWTLALLLCAPLVVEGQDASDVAPVEGSDYVVYESDGDDASFADLLRAMDDADVLLVGEEHDDMVGHGIQAELLSAASRRFGAGAGRERSVVLSLEMFETDVQYVVDEYLDGLISEDQFLKSARPWPFYEARYRPMVEFARERRIPIVAANAPRRYVNRITREGPNSLEVLSELARSYLPPLPYPGPSAAYRAEWDALMAEAMAGSQPDTAANAPQHRPNTNAIYSQALWDASMGYSVAGALDADDGALLLHMVGSFHVRNGTGIPERLDEYRPETRQVTVVMVKADDPRAWDDDEYEDLGDFVILTRKPPPAHPVSD